LAVSSLILALTFAQESSSETSSETSTETSSESSSSTETSDESSSSESSSDESSSGETLTTVSSNYFRRAFGSLYIAYAIDKCSSTDFVGTSYIMPTCIDDNTISIANHSNSDCTSLQSTKMYNSSSDQVFKCDGVNTYAGFSLGSGTCDATVYAAIDACVLYSPSSTTSYSSVTCSSSAEVDLNIYTSSTCDGTSVGSFIFGESCAYSFTYLSVLEVYGQAIDCSATSTIQTTSSGESSSESDDDDDESGDTTTTTTTSGTNNGATTTSATTSTPNSGNMISLKNIFGIFVMIACLIVTKL